MSQSNTDTPSAQDTLELRDTRTTKAYGATIRTEGPEGDTYVRANRDKLKVLGSILGSFTAGGLVGALAFEHLSYAATIPIALLLAGLALVPVLDDLRAIVRSRLR